MVNAVLLFVVGLVLICLGGDRLVDAAVAIARKLGIPQIVVGATIVSLGTTLPEILVSTTAAFDGSAAIAAGNAFGSIICNTALIAGLTQTIRPSRKVEFSSMAWRSAFFFIVLIAMNGYGFVTGTFDRTAGIAMLILFAVYAYLNIKRSSKEGGEEENHVKCWKIIWFGVEKYPHIFGRLRYENMWIMWTVIALKDFPQCLQRLRRP